MAGAWLLAVLDLLHGQNRVVLVDRLPGRLRDGEQHRGEDCMIACLLSTGFTVDRDEPSGIALIAASLRERLPKGSYIYQGEWDEDWPEIPRSEPVQAASVVALIDHSYGWIGHVKFCAAYAPKRVELMCPIDPLPRWWSNMIQAVAGAALGRPIGTLQLPATVDRCLYWRQVQARPYGRSFQGTVSTCPVCW